LTPGPRRLPFAVFFALALALASAPVAARAAETGWPWEGAPDFKDGEPWPLRNFEGLDFLEPLAPRVALDAGDWGRITLDSAIPYALLATSLAAESTDKATLAEISRWGWVGIDEKQDDVPFMFGMIGLSAVSLFLPAPEDVGGYSWRLRLDRATVLAVAQGLTAIETEVLKVAIARPRPDSGSKSSRPSGHASATASAAAFMCDVLRDTLRPQEEDNLGLRILEETASALPYLGAAYMSLERVHAHRHYLTDTLLGDAIGAFTTHMLYSWSFLRLEEGRPWIELASIGYDPEARGVSVVFTKPF
jgi:membrane-associated phospholipid phosphatase